MYTWKSDFVTSPILAVFEVTGIQVAEYITNCEFYDVFSRCIASFLDVGLSLNIDGSEDHQMRFQGTPRGLPSDIIIG